MPAINGMGDGSQLEMASFRVAEFSDVVDWRPMLFQEPIIAQRACALCGVVYKKAVRLPCVHTLCTKCHAQCVDKGSMCPVDQERFCERDVEELEISAEYILNRKHSRSKVCAPDNLATEDLTDVGSACLEMKRAMGKISEDLMSLQTSLNRCSEDVKAEGARSKGQSEAEASKLAEQLNSGFAEELRVLQGAIADYKDHVSKELRLLGCCKPVRVHWYIEEWTGLKKKALEGRLHYSVSQVFDLGLKEGKLRVGCYMKICPGKQDLQLEWPFRKVYTVGVIHPKDQSNVISETLNPANVPWGTPNLTTAEKLETGGFIESDTLHVFLEVEP
ncbi:hypothetical protein HPB47_017883 [Ixodes persulcatus]|uniref:Uncharacterized protein n=1 Tax=Ixodes persulcatus TaxID=34615 RepID=A0AC60QPR7_IXOPE|nr:hypothetical protein HPB47_017883 [Ixodes persulcatus]